MSKITSFSLNAAQIVPEFGGGSDTVPTGWYKCKIGSIALSETRLKNGINALVAFIIVSGFYAGKSISDTYNLISDKGEPNDLSQRRLAAVGHAANELNMIINGQVNPNLLNKPVIVRFKLEEDTYNGDVIIRNRIDGVRSATEQMQTVEDEIEAIPTVRKARGGAVAQELFGTNPMQTFATTQPTSNPFGVAAQAPTPAANPFATAAPAANPFADAPSVAEQVQPVPVQEVIATSAPIQESATISPFVDTPIADTTTAAPSWLQSL